MKLIDVQQGSVEWFRARLGLPTASNFDKIITPKTGQLSKSADSYALKLIAERLLNQPMDSIEGQEWMDRGKELEPTAAKQYEFVNDVETVPCGFITTDDGRFGASPDRLIKGQPRALEIKCPSPHVHLGYLLTGAADSYRPQVQGQIYVAELERVDLYAYHPMMPAATIQTPRDDGYIALLAAALDQFHDRMMELEQRARALGVFQAQAEARTPTEIAHSTALSAELLDNFGIPP